MDRDRVPKTRFLGGGTRKACYYDDVVIVMRVVHVCHSVWISVRWRLVTRNVRSPFKAT